MERKIILYPCAKKGSAVRRIRMVPPTAKSAKNNFAILKV